MKIARVTATAWLAEATVLLQRFFAEEEFATSDELIAQRARIMAEDRSLGLFVALVDQHAVGVASCSMGFGIEFGLWGEMGDLYVLPEWRGRGVANALCDAIERFVLESGGTGYQVTVTPIGEKHFQLSEFYRKQSFTDDGRRLLLKYLV